MDENLEVAAYAKGHTRTHMDEHILEAAKSAFKVERMYLCRNSKHETVIIGFDKNYPHDKTYEFQGFKVFIKHPNDISDQEDFTSASCINERNKLAKEDQIRIWQCIKKNSATLWKNHSNLTVITGDTVKLIRGEPKSKPCIVLYCQWKGFIPLDETSFPRTLSFEEDVLDVDVREGFFSLGPSTKHGTVDQFNDPLCMGSSIGTKGRLSKGTIGLFVDLPGGEQGFLTCCHVLFDCTKHEHFSFDSRFKQRRVVVQPADGSFCGRDDVDCGIIEKGEFRTDTFPAVDAALVKVTQRRANSGHLTIKDHIQVADAGNDYICKYNDIYFFITLRCCEML